ncbi:precorrin-2 dehydrogenase/sirohydrochlorin ferrochelatase family protein [Bacillus marinisedimentorum]|uniref:precorrin-2 dehydrogenase/sirohydrochlorin ferrochelatase family protein n=1 Tax=Bacillus marinisedimentorum TaxID=1821260 RepID=UPI0008720B2C|nr:NAD(P)-dependent oxidoreductase [Bacillus marinisedimentorum]
MKNLYPAMLNLKGRTALVVGGGKVAERKMNALIDAGAEVVVVAPNVTEAIGDLARKKAVRWIRRRFSSHMAAGAFLIIAATNDRQVNQEVAVVAGPNKLINITDDPERSTYHVPSVIRRGRLCITVSTGGASPKLARKIRDEIAAGYSADYEEYMEFLFEKRKEIKQKISNPEYKQHLLAALLDERFIRCDDREAEFRKLLE